MKKFFGLVLVTALFSLTGCLEIVRDITINENGSGNFVSRIDLGEIIEMARSMGQDKQLEEARSKEVDSTLQFKDLVAGDDKLSAEEKLLLKDGSLRVAIKVDSNLFYATANLPFKKVEDIDKINQLSQRILSKSMDSFLEEEKAEEPKEEESQLGATFDEYYTTVYTKNSIEKRLIKEKYEAAGSDEALKAMQEGAAMGMDIKSKIVYRLPRTAKKVEGKNAVLSEDKKTVTISTGLGDFVADGTALEFKITY